MFYDINYWAWVVAVIINYFLGAFWYSPKLFGKMWMEDLKCDPSTMTCTKWHYVGAFIVSLVIGWVQACLSNTLGIATAGEGVSLAFFLWLGFIATTKFSAFLWEKLPLRVLFIDLGYWLVGLIIMGIIFAVWR